jgi:hypothetical protein
MFSATYTGHYTDRELTCEEQQQHSSHLMAVIKEKKQLEEAVEGKCGYYQNIIYLFENFLQTLLWFPTNNTVLTRLKKIHLCSVRTLKSKQRNLLCSLHRCEKLGLL